MSENSDDCEGHAGAIAIRVTHEDFGREPIVLEQRQRAQEERYYDRKRVHMILNDLLRCRSILPLVDIDFDYVVDHYEAPDYEALAYFEAVYAGVNVYGIGAEYGDVSHVNVVEDAQVDGTAKHRSQHFWYNNGGETLICNQ